MPAQYFVVQCLTKEQTSRDTSRQGHSIKFQMCISIQSHCFFPTMLLHFRNRNGIPKIPPLKHARCKSRNALLQAREGEKIAPRKGSFSYHSNPKEEQKKSETTKCKMVVCSPFYSKDQICKIRGVVASMDPFYEISQPFLVSKKALLFWSLFLPVFLLFLHLLSISILQMIAEHEWEPTGKEVHFHAL